jgi:hypothetical protein
MTNPKNDNRGILETEEIDHMIDKADTIKNEYFRLRAKCLVAVAKKFGKRRTEMARLTRPGVKIEGDNVEFTFNLAKKHKRGFFQYLKEMRSLIEKGKLPASVLEKPLPELEKDWRVWQDTKAGHRIKTDTSPQSISTSDKYAKYVLDYLAYLDQNTPDAQFLFPSGRTLFGMSYIINPNEHLTGRQLLRIIKTLDPEAWLHLFRETKGAEVAKAHGRTLTSVYNVKDALDLENEETAYRYVRRFAVQRQPVET